jgi:hypothetical protein
LLSPLTPLVDYYPMRNESNYLPRLIYVRIIIATRKEYPLCEVEILIKFLGAPVVFSPVIRQDPPPHNNNNFDPDDLDTSACTQRARQAQVRFDAFQFANIGEIPDLLTLLRHTRD